MGVVLPGGRVLARGRGVFGVGFAMVGRLIVVLRVLSGVEIRFGRIEFVCDIFSQDPVVRNV